MLVKGCKKQRSNQGKTEQRTPAAQGLAGSTHPQHKGFDIQRRCPTRELRWNAESLHWVCAEGETLVSLRFWVTDCSKINGFRPNQKHKQGIIKGMLWGGVLRSITKDHQIICESIVQIIDKIQWRIKAATIYFASENAVRLLLLSLWNKKW